MRSGRVRSVRGRVRVLAVGAPLVLGGALGGQASPGDESKAVSAPAPDVDGAQAQYDRALGLLRAARRTKAPRSRELIRQAVQLLQRMRRDHPAEKELAAQAAFRAAGLLLALGDAEAARAEYLYLCGPEVPPSWGCRALLEVGRLERRAKRPAEALDAYLRAVSIERAPRRWRDEAALGAAKAHFELRELEAGRRLLVWVAERSPDVFMRIRAFDEHALSFVGSGDLGAAAGVLEACRTATRGLAFEQTPRGERVLRALERMRCITALERAVARAVQRTGRS